MHVNHSNKHIQALKHNGFSPTDCAPLLEEAQTHVVVLLLLFWELVFKFFIFFFPLEESSAGADIKSSSHNGTNPSWLQ